MKDSIVTILINTLINSIKRKFFEGLDDILRKLLSATEMLYHYKSVNNPGSQAFNKFISMGKANESKIKRLITGIKNKFLKGEFAVTKFMIHQLKKYIELSFKLINDMMGVSLEQGEQMIKNFDPEGSLLFSAAKKIFLIASTFLKQYEDIVGSFEQKVKFEMDKEAFKKGDVITIDRMHYLLKRRCDTALDEALKFRNNLLILIRAIKNGDISDAVLVAGSLLSGGLVSIKAFITSSSESLSNALILCLDRFLSLKESKMKGDNEYIIKSKQIAFKEMMKSLKSVIGAIAAKIITLDEIKKILKKSLDMVFNIPNLKYKFYEGLLKIFNFVDRKLKESKEQKAKAESTYSDLSQKFSLVKL